MSWIHMNLNRRMILLFLLLMFAKPLHFAFCPPPCKCTFNDTIQYNKANCENENGLLNLTWTEDYTRTPMLTIFCHGTNYTCTDIPQFNITHFAAKATVSSCAPTILECVNDIFKQPTKIVEVITRDIMDSYSMENFQKLEEVVTLYLELRDADTAVPIEILNSLPKLLYVTIKGGNLRLLPNMFNKTHLKSIELNNNNILFIPDYTFNGTTLTMIKIFNNMYIENISSGAFIGLDHLNGLILENNPKLRFIDPEVVSDRKSLEFLLLAYNALASLPTGFLHGLADLKMVVIDNNAIELNLGSELFARLPSFVEILEVNHCKITTLPEDLYVGSRFLENINLEDNLIKALPSKIFWSTTAVREIFLNNNQINILPEGIFSKLKNLRSVYLRDNNIIEINKNVFTYSPMLSDIFLDRNEITVLDLNLYNGWEIMSISLDSNKIQKIIGNKTLPFLKLGLSLQNNGIEVLDDWLLQVTDYVVLNLTRNKIKTIKASHIDIFKNIKLDLTHNEISTINNDKLDLNTLRVPFERKAYLYLSHNPINCDCIVSNIINKWNSFKVLIDFNDIICTDNTKLAEINVHKLCNRTQALVGLIGSSAVGALVLFLLFCTLITSRRKIMNDLRNIFIQNKTDVASYQSRLDKLKTYDVFVSFAHQDVEFVMDKLMPKLEKDFCQKVCVHYRDWIVGDLIPDQIIKSVESSRITLIVLTEHFVVSEWSYLEFQTAHNLSKQEGRSKLIIILLDESIISDKNLPADLKSYIVLNDYLLCGDTNFWEKVKKLLPRQGKKHHKNCN